MNLVDELYAVAAALTAAGVPYAVCGGVAVTAHGAPRMTKDIDVLVGRDDVARVLEIVRPLGYAFPALPMVFEEGTPRERHVQRVSKLAGKQHLSFVSRATLLRMKRLAGRTQDLADIEKLEAVDDA